MPGNARLWCVVCSRCVSLEPHLLQGKAKNIRVIAKDKYYHVKCYKCEVGICVCMCTCMYSICTYV